MARKKFTTLTEQMFYTLLVLKAECIGTDIMSKVAVLTHDRVVIGPGTLYNLLDQFLEEKMIKETRREGRKKYYIITDKGEEVLADEVKRLEELLKDYKDSRGE